MACKLQNMENIFDKHVTDSIKTRLSKLRNESKPRWGKMNAGQMLRHCQAPLNIVLQKNTYNLKPNWFARTFFKRSMYSDALWWKNMPTIKSFRETEDRDFDREYESLMNLLEELESKKDDDHWPAHPVFGKLTRTQWGKMQFKHLDHHLRQFGL